MSNKTGFIVIIVLLLIIVAGLGVLIFVPGKSVAPSQQPSDSTGVSQPGSATASSTATQASLNDVILVTAPLINATVSSPLTVTGQARGTWYFEASAPYELRDASGKVIAQGHIDAQSDWMTTNFVPFKATITFPAQPKGSTGTLVLQNDNPSGDPERQKELRIPVKF